MRLPKKKLLTILIPSISAFIIILVMLLLAFIPVASKTEVFEANCEEDGAVYKCSLFGYKYKIEDIPALGHNLTGIVQAKSPTCTETGTTAGIVCSRCGIVFEEVTPLAKLNHFFKNGRCVDCGLTCTESVNDVSFSLNGSANNTLNYVLFGGNISTLLEINGGVYDQSQSPFGVSFEFEEDIDAKIENGELYIGDVLGTIHLIVTIQGSNVVTKTIAINVVCPEDAELTSLVALSKATSRNYIEGELFDSNTVSVWGHYSIDNQKKLIRILDFDYGNATLDPSVSEIEITYQGKRVAYPILVQPKTLQSIDIETAALTTEYIEGQYFDPTGLTIKANYEYLSTNISNYVIETESYLKESDKNVRISFSDNGVIKYVEHPVKVGPKKLLELTIDDSDVQKEYTVGDCFDPDGLIVKATYKYSGEQVITDYSFSQDTLSSDTEEVLISYSIGDVSIDKPINVTAKAPYQQLSRIKVLTPADVAISWVYKYKEDGNDILDNTKWQDRSLLYDTINGLYDVPVGAIVTATVRNPAMIDIAIDGINREMNYVEKSISWKIKSHNGIDISLVEMSGAHSVIRFTGDGKDQFFLYEGLWNGQLTEDNLERLNVIYSDNDVYYYTFLIDGKTLRYESLSSEHFVKNSIIAVAKNAIVEHAKNVVLHLGENVSYTIRIPKEEAELWSIPSFEKAGYYYRGWANENGGKSLTQEQIVSLLQSEEEDIDLFIIWEEEVVDYSSKYLHFEENMVIISDNKIDDNDISMIGEWYASDTVDNESISCNLTINANGTFDYSIIYNDELNCQYRGKYRLIENSVVVIFSEPRIEDIPYLNGADFGIVLGQNGLECSLIVINNDKIDFGLCQIEHR